MPLQPVRGDTQRVPRVLAPSMVTGTAGTAVLAHSAGPWRAGHPGCFALSPVICAVRTVVLGRQEWGSGGKPGTGRFGALGGFRVSPQCVSRLVPPPACLLVE